MMKTERKNLTPCFIISDAKVQNNIDTTKSF